MALIINGTAGNDWLVGGEYSADYLDGLTGDDTLSGFGGDDILIGNMGNDLLAAGGGKDNGIGGSGDDEIWMGGGNDFADGGPGADLIGGGSGNDVLWGDNGWLGTEVTGLELTASTPLRELLAEGMGSLLGLVGEYPRDPNSHDTIWGGTGNDIILGGLGNDVAGGGTGNDQISGGRGNDKLYGFDGNDVLFGNDEDDLIFGGNGNDDIYDGGGSDTVWGGAGDDRMFAGNQEGHLAQPQDWDLDACLDNDTDTFAFEGCHGSDTIYAFDARNIYQNEEDLIDLRAYGYNSMDDVNIQYFADAAAYNAADLNGDGDSMNDADLEYPVEGYGGIAYIQNPSCCDCYGTSENNITVAYIGTFDSGNILL